MVAVLICPALAPLTADVFPGMCIGCALLLFLLHGVLHACCQHLLRCCMQLGCLEPGAANLRACSQLQHAVPGGHMVDTKCGSTLCDALMFKVGGIAFVLHTRWGGRPTSASHPDAGKGRGDFSSPAGLCCAAPPLQCLLWHFTSSSMPMHGGESCTCVTWFEH